MWIFIVLDSSSNIIGIALRRKAERKAGEEIDYSRAFELTDINAFEETSAQTPTTKTPLIIHMVNMEVNTHLIA